MIKPPTIKNSRWAARSVGHPSHATKTFFKTTGNKTRKAAPAKLPNIEPKPPIMIMNNILNDLVIQNASVSAAPR